MSATMLRDYAWSDRTSSTRNSQWETWVEFCKDDGREVLPVTEGHILSFIGWIAIARQEKRRSISSRSVPQYISAVRQMQVVLTGVPVPTFPLLPHVLRGFERWEEERFPPPDIRSGLSSEQVQRIWGMGMATSLAQTVRDCAVCVFAFCFNGLLDSSVMSIQTKDVQSDHMRIRTRLSIVKGKRASREQFVEYYRVGALTSPLDLLLRWENMRASHPLYLSLSIETQKWRPGTLDAALGRVLRRLNITAPTGCKYSSHSLRIGSHTEQVLLGIPLEVRLARFGWAAASQEMAALYFDRTLRTTAASFWFFATAGSASSVVPTPSI